MRDYHAFEWLFDAYLELGMLEAARLLVLDLEHINSAIGKNGEPPGEVPSLLRLLGGYYQRASEQAQHPAGASALP